MRIYMSIYMREHIYGQARPCGEKRSARLSVNKAFGGACSRTVPSRGIHNKVAKGLVVRKRDCSIGEPTCGKPA